MTQPRKTLIDLNQTSYYHCIARCVRRAFLCGEDAFSGKNYEHRKDWVVERLSLLADTFAIDVASYAIMSNHYHLVLRVDIEKAEQWSEANVIRRWKRLYKIPLIVNRYLKGNASPALTQMAQELITKWRQRLTDISWFMRCLNEYLARKANLEDQCTGRFWEGRFKSQALLDEAAVVTAMAYVDLNPIRANLASTPEDSDYTSVKQRIRNEDKDSSSRNVKLMKLTQSSNKTHRHGFNVTEADYLELVDYSGRAIRCDKRGYIPSDLPPILERLNLEPDGFLELMQRDDNIAGLRAVGSPSALTHLLDSLDQRFIKGVGISNRLYSS
ncbi:transcription factor IIS helical bundle-like domain-containing protein [Pleionea litopenaei]|uniref:Transcription factor IIS helical bundle-like domain-containing protein n=1 Tax=Pleionea litopenaei TaxID=3070815 RepID=A0AA51X6Q0_9GAMM|nr:transcription factor IIS helical bundle-like domain-containing protein [Pleionea sp. HL-JVS1]WMS87517.1 transcription factor IIS helical bundle-like domain-containing protein [Pleionea sp. HL-JVS1]